MQIEQFEILLQIQVPKKKIANFECFKVFFGSILMVSVVFFVKL